ncbi:ABC transporter permease [Shimia thalassica]|uniref:ABC transporter permease n=1 Tax=Shimia thalassica TaxID=1715693 RepID=UPI000C06F1A2|nr:ABC transporter permease [Shimia thalassica]PHO03033.1 ABC transporter permease [Rhodobacteraceae bacterium 4F10]MBU2942918.1 ABC transporter permease [Shimia thalassica]MDO6479220.1 ABC transporter permease [Shimia thalassica]MDO6482248.1 ABC transporter permease [Shimia thalassica]MDO6502759.1 ABC transporter permease [Shimia thalassica]
MNSILSIILKRLMIGLLTLWVVTIIIFAAIELLPGDIATEILGQAATEESLAAFREKYDLNRPVYERYISWLSGAVTGDFGVSLANQRPISELIGQRTANTFFLAAYAAAIAVPIAVVSGMMAALYNGSMFDRILSSSTLAAISFPEFFVAYILILVFSVGLGWFPSLANVDVDMGLGERLYLTFLPAMTLTLIVLAYMMRMTRAAILNLLALPYIEMAHLKGIKRWRVIAVHALPNALAPIINVIALNLAYLIVGVVLVEVVFVYPGLGQVLVDAVSNRDVTVVQAACLIFAATYILLNLLADILSIVANPRLLHPR